MEDGIKVKQEPRSLKGVIAAVVFCAGSLALFLYTMPPYNAESHWLDYLKTYHNVSIAGLMAGPLWLVFALLKARTHFFELDRKISQDEFNTSLAVVILALIVALSLALTKIPSLVPKEKADTDSPERTRFLKLDRNVKILASSMIILSGLIVLSVPFRRLKRRERPGWDEPGEGAMSGNTKKKE